MSMAILATHQSCWNHESREAVCKCLNCGRSYCRECVTEHQGRLLCASCLNLSLAKHSAGVGVFRKMAPAILIAAGLLIAWLAFWGFGEVVIGLFRRNVFGGQPTSQLAIPARALRSGHA